MSSREDSIEITNSAMIENLEFKTIASQIRATLSPIIDPELKVSIVELGMIGGIDLIEGEVKIDLALTTIACPLRSQIQKEISSKISTLLPNAKVSFNVIAMSQADKAKAMQLARSAASKNAPNNSIPSNARIIAIASGKGGVGKSTTTSAMALGLAELGYRIGILDADIWGFSIPKILGMQAKVSASGTTDQWKIDPLKIQFGDGSISVVSMGFLSQDPTSAIMWRGLVLNRAFQHFIEDVDWSDIDYLLIDMPPGTGDIQMGLSRMLPQAQVIIVTTPSDAANEVAIRMLDMAQRGNLSVLGFIENMAYFLCDHGQRYEIFGKSGLDSSMATKDIEVLARIPISKANSDLNLNDMRAKWTSNDPDHSVEVMRKFAKQLTTEIAPIQEMSGCTSRIEQLLKKIELDKKE
ncbi:P-loop NTPase [Acidithrix ferrooxidans]|uniref:Iron-sulfur cluster carrier protein n=2 Tax=Acidithrix TaxID=1609233 RepID=A0A0D8HMF5_9ACTN|nr:P-loop NTPase [Acidithrix ferrooxidans]KJF18922.1 septum site-determining protein MinD [Acidithrix ferrooxidans]